MRSVSTPCYDARRLNPPYPRSVTVTASDANDRIPISEETLADLRRASTATITTQLFSRGLKNLLPQRAAAAQLRPLPVCRRGRHAAQHPDAGGSRHPGGPQKSRSSPAQGDRDGRAGASPGDGLPGRDPGRLRRQHPDHPVAGAGRGGTGQRRRHPRFARDRPEPLPRLRQGTLRQPQSRRPPCRRHQRADRLRRGAPSSPAISSSATRRAWS